MRKKKLTLRLDELCVTSFDPGRGRMPVDGTVKAHEGMPPTEEPCYSFHTYCSACAWTDCC